MLVISMKQKTLNLIFGVLIVILFLFNIVYLKNLIELHYQNDEDKIFREIMFNFTDDVSQDLEILYSWNKDITNDLTTLFEWKDIHINETNFNTEITNSNTDIYNNNFIELFERVEKLE